MKRKIIIGLLFVAGLGVSAGFFLYQKPSAKIVSANAEHTLSAAQLFDEFNEHESEANTKYLNKVLSVSGIISEISAVDSQGLTILLETGNPLFGVSCQLPQGNSTKLLRHGQEVKVKGLCTGKLMDVVLVKCVVEERSDETEKQ
jgi:hypothetical protein